MVTHALAGDFSILLDNSTAHYCTCFLLVIDLGFRSASFDATSRLRMHQPKTSAASQNTAQLKEKDLL